MRLNHFENRLRISFTIFPQNISFTTRLTVYKNIPIGVFGLHLGLQNFTRGCDIY